MIRGAVDILKELGAVVISLLMVVTVFGALGVSCGAAVYGYRTVAGGEP